MTIRDEAWHRVRTVNEHEQVTAAVFAYVALDEAGRPRPVPRLRTSVASEAQLVLFATSASLRWTRLPYLTGSPSVRHPRRAGRSS
jgi:acyl-CoA hydrolase